MAKRRLKSNTLAGFWKNIKTVSITDEAFVSPDSLAFLQQVVDEVNSSSVPSSMAAALVVPYFDDKTKSEIRFGVRPERFSLLSGEIVRPVSKVDGEDSVFDVDAVGLLLFAEMFSSGARSAEEIGLDFKQRRQARFMMELAKLPEPYLVYLAILQEVAYVNEIVSVEDREGRLHSSDAGFYLSLLWAFKEFEAFYLKTQNRYLRADYCVVWHEGEWIADVKRGKGYIDNE